MATRRRIGVSAATTEAARRQLMQPVPCWEKQFSDDEDEADEPLAPLPDEAEVVEGDDDEQDETRNEASEVPQVKELADMDTNQDDPPSKVPSPKPQLMMLGSSNDDDNQDITALDASLKPMDDIDENDKQGLESLTDGLELDISVLGPDGLQLEDSHDLSQLDGPDGLIGGTLMDESGDPFADGGPTLS